MDYVLSVLTLAGIYAVIALGYDLVFGHSGLFSAAPVAFYAIGAYAGALVLLHVSDQFIVGVVAAVAAAGIAGWVVAKALVRLTGDYFVIGTLGVFGLVIAVITNWYGLTKGDNGLVGIPAPQFGTSAAVSNLDLFVVMIVGLSVAMFIAWRVVGSPFGRLLHAARDESTALASLGHDPVRVQRAAFTLGAALTGLAGVLYATNVTYIDPSSFTFNLLVMILAMVVVGGTGTVVGSVLGAALVVGLQQLFTYVNITSAANAGFVQGALFGLLLVVFMMLRPRGLLPEASVEKWRRRSHRVPGPEEFSDRSDEESQVKPARAVSLEIQRLNKAFGGNQVICDVDLRLEPGRIVAIVGPNGAGKSTLVSCIVGDVVPDSGSVCANGHDVTGWQPHRLPNVGVARTFQAPRLFESMTVAENVEMGAPRACGQRMWHCFLRPGRVAQERKRIQEESARLIEWVGLTELADHAARELSGGQQKLVSLARTLATEASVILLDEPTAGVAPDLIPGIVTRVRSLRDSGRTVCIIEHRREIVAEIADWVVVMDQGRVVMEGATDDVLGSEVLEKVYLGSVGAPAPREDAKYASDAQPS